MKKENYFLSSDGKTMIHYTMWYPEKRIRGVIQLTHGMTEYMENYNEFAEFLCENDFFVAGHDQLGHGHSVKSSNELGHFINKNSVDILVEDMYNLMKKVRSEYPDMPYFLFGHSFGSFLSRIFAGTYGNKLSGLILTGTGNADIKKVKHALKLIRAIRITKKADYRSSLVQKTLFTSYSERIENPENMHEWICRDEKSIEDYLNDPLNNYVYTLNGFSTLLYAVLKMQEERVFEDTPEKLPILMMSGSEDPVGNYGEKVLEVCNLYKEHKVKDVTLKIYKGARHNILMEINKKGVMKDCMEWILNKLD